MRSLCNVVLACVLVSLTSPVLASFTVYNPPYPPEATIQEVISAAYGGLFVPAGAGGLDFTNGTISAVRIEDLNSSQEQPTISSLIGPIGGDDQLWKAEFISALAIASWGRYQMEFGYFEGESGGTYHKLFNQTGWADQVSGSAELSQLSGQVIRWARGGEYRVFSSLSGDTAADNWKDTAHPDHMITYRIDGLPDASEGIYTWLIFWEDKLPWEVQADYDYNDMVVQIKTRAIHVEVPEPGAAAAILLLGLLAIRMR